MLDIVLELLRKGSYDGWTVTDVTTEAFEYYFIRHELDQNRVRSTRHISITLYRSIEDGKYFGNASGEIAPTATKEEAEELISRLYEEAKLVKNKPYALNPELKMDEEATKIDVASIAQDFIEAMNNLNETKTEDVNSYEIFVDSIRKRFISSTGIDVTTTYPKSLLEVVVNARKDKHEIELYRMYTSGTCDPKQVAFDVNETLHYGKDKLVAKKTPNFGKMDVIFSTDAALQIYDWFITRMDAKYQYMRLSDWKLNEPIAKDVKGDKVTIETTVYLKNSSDNATFDPEGAKREDKLIIEDGIARGYHGSRMFSQYLNVENSFIPGNFLVKGGSKSAEELRSGEYLEIVEFSDFQVSPFTGDIAGEIRLGYYHKANGEIVPVEGGSVSGMMSDFVKEMYLSKETRQYDTHVVPSVTKLCNVTVTGAE